MTIVAENFKQADLTSLTKQFDDVGNTVDDVVKNLNDYKDDVQSAVNIGNIAMIVIASVLLIFLILTAIGACYNIRCCLVFNEFLLPFVAALAFIGAALALITWYLVDDTCLELGNYMRNPKNSTLSTVFDLSSIDVK